MNPPGAHALPLPGGGPGTPAPDFVETGTRGQTVLAARVIEKIAAQVASDESSAGGSSGGFLGIGTRADLSARPKASVELSREHRDSKRRGRDAVSGAVTPGHRGPAPPDQDQGDRVDRELTSDRSTSGSRG